MAEGGTEAIIIDNGSYKCKAGLSGDEEPKAVFPPVVGRPKHEGVILEEMSQAAFYSGKRAQRKKGVLDMQSPFKNGVVTNWNDMLIVWSEAVSKLQVNPQERPILLTEPPLNPKANRERMTQIMFETFHTSAMYTCIPAVLSLYSQGLTTGVSLDSGDTQTYIVPVDDNDVLHKNIMKFDLAGRDLTDYLMKLIDERGVSLRTTDKRETIRDMKEKTCYIVLDLQKEKASISEKTYKLPNGDTFQVGNEMVGCPESLFNPYRSGIDSAGIQHVVHNSISKCDRYIQKDLYSNIVLTGGNTSFPGFENRLEQEITSLAPGGMSVSVIAPLKREYAVWMGGSILASLSTFREMCITKQEYNEFGPNIVHSKCF